MRNYFVDTNVVIDLLANREPFCKQAARLFEGVVQKKHQLFISAVSYNNIYYIIRQSSTHKQTVNLLKDLNDLVEIVPVTSQVIEKALHSDMHDFEDAMQYYCALQLPRVDAIVTRNLRDYKKSKIAVLSPEQVID